MDSLRKRAEEAEDFQTALVLWRELATGSREDSFFLSYGRVAQKLERWQEAENAFSEALRLDPSSSLTMENIGSLWAYRTDKSDVESFKTANQWFLDALKHERHARVLTHLGATYTALDDEAAARDAFEEAMQIDPDYEEALYNLARLDQKTNPERAIHLLERAIQIDPNYAVAHQELGALYQSSKDLIRADYHFRRSLEIDPADYWSNLYLANLLGVQGRNAEAEEMYKRATRLHPEISGGFDLYANFLAAIGEPGEAAKVRESTKS